jgi:hypothetical protein
MTTFLDDRRLGGAATAILGHKTKQSQANEREQLASVTEQHYNRSQKIDLKADGMMLWVKALLTACEKENRKLQLREKLISVAEPNARKRSVNMRTTRPAVGRPSRAEGRRCARGAP